MNKSVLFSAKQQRKSNKVNVLMTTWAYKKSLVLGILFINGAHTNPVVGFLANIVKCEQDGIIAK